MINTIENAFDVVCKTMGEYWKPICNPIKLTFKTTLTVLLFLYTLLLFRKIFLCVKSIISIYIFKNKSSTYIQTLLLLLLSNGAKKPLFSSYNIKCRCLFITTLFKLSSQQQQQRQQQQCQQNTSFGFIVQLSTPRKLFFQSQLYLFG